MKNYEVTQSIVAELKKLQGARYPKKIDWMAASQKLTKSYYEKLRFALIRGYIINIDQIG